MQRENAKSKKKKPEGLSLEKNFLMPLKSVLKQRLTKRKLIRLNTDKRKELLKEKLIQQIHVAQSTPRSRSVKTKKQTIKRFQTDTFLLSKSQSEAQNTFNPFVNHTTDDIEDKRNTLIRRLRIFGEKKAETESDNMDTVGLIKKAIIESNISYVPDIVQRMKALEKDNWQLKKELEDNKAKLRTSKRPKKAKTSRNTKQLSSITETKDESEDIIKELRLKNKKLENQIKKMKKGTAGDRSASKPAKKQTDAENRKLMDLLKKDKSTVDKFLKKKVLDLGKQIKKLETENKQLRESPRDSEDHIQELNERVDELELENKRILTDYFNIKKMFEGNETYEDLLMYRNKVDLLQKELQAKDEQIKKMKAKSLAVNFV